MIKTLHITNSYHPSSGGIRTFYLALLKAANTHRRLVRLVVPGPESSVEEIGDYGRIYTIAAPRAPVLDHRYHILTPHDYFWPGETPLRQILEQERPDLVEICDKLLLHYLTGVLRRRWIPGVPVPALIGLTCERLDDMAAFHVSSGSAARWLSQSYMRKLYVPRFDFHIAVSDYTAAEVRRALPPGKQDRLYVEPMGVDCERFCKTQERPVLREELLRCLEANGRTAVLLYAGRLGHEKNLLLLPQTLKKLRATGNFDFRFVVAGSGPLKAQLRAAFEDQTPGAVLFLGQCGADRLAELYAAADAFVHPNAHEPFGIAPLEAMAAGLPLVAPASGGLLTYANRRNAWLTEATPGDFAAAIESALSDGPARREKLEKARKTTQEFSWSRVTARYFLLYDRLHARFQDEGMSKRHAKWNKPANELKEDSHEFVPA
ncbi:MAG TPA: glycosyltransferase [Candidatus Acidoferrum sp.]|nr:glycosyltransferase [Candidatus Acidoferrum sp.]